MYSYLDRPVTTLDAGGRLLVWAVRRWLTASQQRFCPIDAIGPAFSRYGLIPALAPFHRAMILLSARTRQQLNFAPLYCMRIAEGEALLLVLVASCLTRPASALQQTLALLIEADAAAEMGAVLPQLAQAMSSAALLPQIPAPPRLSNPR